MVSIFCRNKLNKLNKGKKNGNFQICQQSLLLIEVLLNMGSTVVGLGQTLGESWLDEI